MIVITGATGNIGQPLVQSLVSAGEEVVTVSRGDSSLGVRHHRADLTEPESLKPAVDGAEALFLLPAADLLAAGDVNPILDVARAGGVRRVVLLSSQGVRTGRHPSAMEDAVRGSGLEWTLLRPGGFDSNTLQWAQSVRTRRVVAAPFADIALPTVDPADIAEVAAAVLRYAGHTGRAYELTGPAPISPRQQASAIAGALGEPVRFVELSHAEARAQLVRFMPAPVADATLDILGTPTAAEQRVSPDIARVLGRPARTFADWVTRTVAAFR